jgi:hypothetical protein
MTFQSGVAVVNGVRNVEGDAKLSCGTGRYKVIGDIVFEDRLLIPFLVLTAAPVCNRTFTSVTTSSMSWQTSQAVNPACLS